jgi:hypothetical protein
VGPCRWPGQSGKELVFCQAISASGDGRSLEACLHQLSVEYPIEGTHAVFDILLLISVTYERILLLKFPNRSFSSARPDRINGLNGPTVSRLNVTSVTDSWLTIRVCCPHSLIAANRLARRTLDSYRDANFLEGFVNRHFCDLFRILPD